MNTAMPISEELVRVITPYFVAGIVLRNGKCIDAASILRWCLGRERDDLRANFKARGYTATIVNQ